MNMNQIKDLARSRGIRPGKHKKTELVRLLQKAESNPQCFNTAYASACGQEHCLWRDDCR